jgi:hypothetical protein
MKLKEVGRYMIGKGIKRLELYYNGLESAYELEESDDSIYYEKTNVSLYDIKTTKYIKKIFSVLGKLPIETDDVDIKTLITLCLGTTGKEKKADGARILTQVLEHLITHSEMEVFDNYIIIAEDD